MFDDARAAGSTRWVFVAGVLLGAGLATLACSGLFVDRYVADRWAAWFPAPDPHADLAVVDASGIDWLRVHRDLLPTWVLAVGRGDDDPAGKEALLAAIRADPELVAAIEGLDAGLGGSDSAAIRHGFDLWNRRLDAARAPFFVDAAAGRGEYVKTYRSLWDGSAQIGERASRVRLLTRVDRLNVIEGYLGQVTNVADGALVVVDRVAEHAADDLWPLLDPHSLDPASGPVAAEIRSSVLPAHWEVLAGTAAARARLMATVRDVRARRDCSGYVVQFVPALGFDDALLEAMSEVARRDRGASCPSLKAGEVAAIEDVSGELRGTDGLPDALEALLAFALRPTAVHEARHVADALKFGSITDVVCAGCPEELESLTGRGELSAYLSSFSAEGVAACAWLQACGATQRGWGSHAAAFATISGVLAREPCDAEVPVDLISRSRDLEADWLLRDDVVTLPTDFPTAVRWPE